VSVDSESQMAKLLEEMAAKLHDELRREKDDRQNTERVLMKLLDDSVEAIALRANDETVAKLKKRRDERDAARGQREKETAERTDYWQRKFKEEKEAAAAKKALAD